MGMNCLICGKPMRHFENPSRYICATSPSEHAKMKRKSAGYKEKKSDKKGKK